MCHTAMVKVNCEEPLQLIIWILRKQGLLSEKAVNALQILKLSAQLCLWLLILTLKRMLLSRQSKIQDISTLNQMICMLISAITVLAKQITTITSKKNVLSILQDLKSRAFNAHNEEQNRYVQFIARMSKLMWHYYITLGIVYFITACLLPFAISMKMVIPPPFDMGRFDFFYKIVQSVMILYMTVNFVAVDVFYMTMLGLCVAQLKILQNKLLNVIETSKENCDVDRSEDGKSNGDEVLKGCVILHEVVNQYVKKLSATLSFPLFIQYTCGCIIICNTVLQMIIVKEGNVSHILILTAFTSATVGQLVLYHWLGNEITFKSHKIIESCYMSQWYDLTRNSQKMLIVLMERSKRPLTVELYNLVNISFSSLGLIIRWSYSLFALFKVTYN